MLYTLFKNSLTGNSKFIHFTHSDGCFKPWWVSCCKHWFGSLVVFSQFIRIILVVAYVEILLSFNTENVEGLTIHIVEKVNRPKRG